MHSRDFKEHATDRPQVFTSTQERTVSDLAQTLHKCYLRLKLSIDVVNRNEIQE
jgi:hypothetical protein